MGVQVAKERIFISSKERVLQMDERYQLQVRDRLAKMQLEIQQILGAVGDPGRNVRLVAVTK